MLALWPSAVTMMTGSWVGGVLAANLLQDLHPAHPRHADIEQDQIRRLVANGGDGRLPIFRQNHFKSMALQPAGQHVPVAFFIVDNQQRHFRFSSTTHLSARSEKDFKGVKALYPDCGL